MSDFLYENLPVAIAQHGDHYDVGVVIHGKLFPFFQYHGGNFDQDVTAAAKDAGEQTPEGVGDSQAQG